MEGQTMSLLATHAEQLGADRRRGLKMLALFISVVIVMITLAGCTAGTSAAVPSDFPDAVPVPAGTVLSAEKADGAWNLSVKLDGKDNRQAAFEKLTDKGFVITGETGPTNDRVYSLASAKHSIRLHVQKVDGDDVLNFAVAERHAASEK